MKEQISRRHFLETASLAGAGLSLAVPGLSGRRGSAFGAEVANVKPAKLGGKPVCSGGWPGWPVYGETGGESPAEHASQRPLVSWQRQGRPAFRGRLRQAHRAPSIAWPPPAAPPPSIPRSARWTSGPATRSSFRPYTFVATYNVVVLNYALPVFVDSDLETFQIDARKIEAAITKDTKVILPVHIGGYSSRPGQDPGGGGQAQDPGHRRRLPGAPGRVARAQGRHVGAGRLLQLPGQQEPQLR